MPKQPIKAAARPTKAARRRRELELRRFFEGLSPQDLVIASNLVWELSLRTDKDEAARFNG